MKRYTADWEKIFANECNSIRRMKKRKKKSGYMYMYN